ncbi:MAG TPA: ABC transporter permease [Chloroflexia bacterium]|nr:ABC transporter permease [Chloroflexia bacterium]
MTKFIIRRLLISIPVLVGISFLIFMLMQLAPGGPLAAFGNNPRMTADQKAAIAKAWGLDKPALEQYVDWFFAMIRGNWGYSFTTRRPVTDMIIERLPATLLLMLVAYSVQQLIALPLGMWSALRRYSFSDKFFTVLTYIGFSMPTFWLGLILIYFFSANLRWFPTGGITDAREPTFFKPDYWQWWGTNPGQALGSLVGHLILPMVTLIVVGTAADSRFMRSSMLETINQDYIRTARAKGLSEGQVVRKHALRPALLPVITNIALTLPGLIGGAVVTETIFSWPGMGRLFIEAIDRADYPIMMGIVFIISILIVIFNLVADVLYAVIDPRIRY